MKFFVTKVAAIVLSVGMIAAFFVYRGTDKVNAAGGITDVTATLSATAKSVSTGLTVTFKLGTGLSSGGKVFVSVLSFNGPNPYNFTSVTRLATTTAGINAIAQSPDGQSLIGSTNASLSANTTYTFAVSGLTNPSSATAMMAVVWTTNAAGSTVIDGVIPNQGPYTSGIFGAVFAVDNVIYGKVTKADGTPVSQAGVQLHSGNWSTSYGSGTNPLGYYSFSTGLTVGSSWVIDVFPPMNAQGALPPDAYSIASYAGGPLVVNRVFGVAAKTITGRVTRDTGAAVAGVNVNAFKPMGGGGGMGQATTDASGNYTLTIGGGNWQVGICSGCGGGGGTTDWAYSKPPTNVTFASNTVAESTTVDFSVITASSIIKGTIVKPDGAVPTQTPGQPGLGINIFSRGGFGTGGGLNSSGAFSVNVPAGTYDVNVFDQNGLYTVSAQDPVVVKSSETKDLGTIRLVEKTDIIRGRVTTSNGTSVAGIGINAMRERGGGDFGNTTTGADGTYSIRVVPGQWMVMAGDFKGQNGEKTSVDYVVIGGGRPVNVVSGVASVVDFTATAASSTISGSLVDSAGAVVKDLFAFIMADVGGSVSAEEKMMGGLGGGVNNGTFSFKVPAGTYTLNVGMPPGSNYTSSGSKSVTVAADATVTTTITMLANDATISGYLVDQDGAKVTNLMGEVFATNGDRSMHPAQVNPTDGSYSISVASAVGPWYLGAWTDPASGYFQEPPSQDGLALSAGGTVTKNVTLRKADATISGKITDNDGAALSGVFVQADTRALVKDINIPRGPMFMNDNRTDTSGNYSVKVPAGTYYVNAIVPPDRGLMPPKAVQTTVAKNATSTVDLQFRKPDSKIIGTVKDGSDNNTAKSGLVWAYSEDGAYTETSAGNDGKFELKVMKGEKWHVGANTEGGSNNTDKYIASDTLISTGTNDSNSQDLVLSKTTNGLPAAANISADVTSTKSIRLTDSAQIDLPANSLGTEGTATVSVSPTAEIGHQYTNKPLEDKAYDITAVGSSGSAVTSLNSNASITLPYDPTVIVNKGLSETTNDIVPAYWNDTDGTWTPISGASINKDNNTVTFTTNHFTKYSLVAASDVTTASTTTTATTLPKTGEKDVNWLYFVISIITLVFVGAVSKKLLFNR